MQLSVGKIYGDPFVTLWYGNSSFFVVVVSCGVGWVVWFGEGGSWWLCFFFFFFFAFFLFSLPCFSANNNSRLLKKIFESFQNQILIRNISALLARVHLSCEAYGSVQFQIKFSKRFLSVIMSIFAPISSVFLEWK